MDLLPEEKLLAALVRLSIRDALQHKDLRVQADAQRFLWTVAPYVAERAAVPRRGLSATARQAGALNYLKSAGCWLPVHGLEVKTARIGCCAPLDKRRQS